MLRDALELRDAAIRALLGEGYTVREVVAMNRRMTAGIRWIEGVGPLPPAPRKTLNAYLNTRVDPLEPLFLSERRQRISAQTIYRIARADDPRDGSPDIQPATPGS